MKIFIVGKINGLSERDYKDKYKNAENKLRSAGWDPVNPLSLEISVHTPLSEILKKFELYIPDIQAIYLLNDWEDALEARLQKSIAKHAHLDIYLEKWHSENYMMKLIQEVI